MRKLRRLRGVPRLIPIGAYLAGKLDDHDAVTGTIMSDGNRDDTEGLRVWAGFLTQSHRL